MLRQLLPGPSVARARQVFGEAGISPLVYTMAQGVERVLWRPEKESPGVARYVASRQRDERLLPVADEEALYQGEVFYFTCIGGREELLPAYEALRQDKALSVLLQEEIYQPGGVLAGGDVRRRHQGPGRRLAERAPGLPAHDSLWGRPQRHPPAGGGGRPLRRGQRRAPAAPGRGGR